MISRPPHSTSASPRLDYDPAVPEPRTDLSSAQSQGYDPAQDYFAEELQLMYLSRKANPETLGDRPLIVLAPTLSP